MHTPETEKIITSELSSWRQTHHLHGVLFDLDETLIESSSIFRQHMQEFAKSCCERIPSLAYEEFWIKFRQINNESFETMKVNPARWITVISQLNSTYGILDNRLWQGLPLLMQIYHQVPNLLPGARKTLSIFKEAGFKLGVITHGHERWSRWKLEKTGLLPFFKDQITITWMNDSKSSKHWGKAIEKMGLPANEIIAVGDNVIGDVQAAKEAGIKTTILLPTEWGIYANGVIPEETIRVDSIGNIPKKLLGML